MTTLKKGDQAPAFFGVDQDGKPTGEGHEEEEEDLDDLDFETNMLNQINAIVHERNEYFSSEKQEDDDALEDHYNENIPSLANMNNPPYHQHQSNLVDEDDEEENQQGTKNLSYSTSSTMSSLSLESPASIAAKLQNQKMHNNDQEGNDKPGTPNSWINSDRKRKLPTSNILSAI